jgi:hypothetical protein
MRISRDDAGASWLWGRCGVAALAGALALWGLAAFAPAPASAMTAEELASICSGVFADLGSPVACIVDSAGGSGGSGVSGGSAPGAIPGPPPETILIVDEKPTEVYCGFGGVYAARLADCLRKPGGGGLRLEADPLREPSSAGRGIPAPGGRKPGRVMSCVLASQTLREVNRARKDLADLASQLHDADYFADVTFRTALHDKLLDWVNRIPHEAWASVFGKKASITDAWSVLTDREFIEKLGRVWDAAVRKAIKDWDDPFCGKALANPKS